MFVSELICTDCQKIIKHSDPMRVDETGKTRHETCPKGRSTDATDNQPHSDHLSVLPVGVYERRSNERLA